MKEGEQKEGKRGSVKEGVDGKKGKNRIEEKMNGYIRKGGNGKWDDKDEEGRKCR